VLFNQAIGGANVQSFKSGNWGKIISVLKAGDYVMIQFGANDSGAAQFVTEELRRIDSPLAAYLK
jgi:lysophospholipase L1-like esterase